MRHWQLINEDDRRKRELQRRAASGDIDAIRQLSAERRRAGDHVGAARVLHDAGQHKEAFDILAPRIREHGPDGHDLMSRSALGYVNSVFDRHHQGEDISTDEMHEAARAAAYVHAHHLPKVGKEAAEAAGHTYNEYYSYSRRRISNKSGHHLIVSHHYGDGDDDWNRDTPMTSYAMVRKLNWEQGTGSPEFSEYRHEHSAENDVNPRGPVRILKRTGMKDGLIRREGIARYHPRRVRQQQ